MLSRVADSILWTSRYIERAENIARFVGVNLHLMLDLQDMPENLQWAPMVSITGDNKIFEERYQDYTQANVLRFLIFDGAYPNSIITCLRAARENARTIRETISSELWHQINSFYLLVNEAARDPEALLVEPQAFMDQVKFFGIQIAGVMDASMTHSEPWHFARMGRLIERADKTSRILDVKYFLLLPQLDYVGAPLDRLQWSAVLKSASALEMYRKRHQSIDPTAVADFLILDRYFPRAIHHCLIYAEESLHAITGVPLGSFSSPAEQTLGRLRSQLDFLTVNEIMQTGLHEFLDQFQDLLNSVGGSIFETFFAMRQHAGQNQQ